MNLNTSCKSVDFENSDLIREEKKEILVIMSMLEFWMK